MITTFWIIFMDTRWARIFSFGDTCPSPGIALSRDSVTQCAQTNHCSRAEFLGKRRSPNFFYLVQFLLQPLIQTAFCVILVLCG